MNTRSLRAVLRNVAQVGSSLSDAELLRRFTARRDESAFTALVHRHGRLVWALCRHLTRSDADADDAFQATFLVLVRNTSKVRDPGKLSAWLHGVAYKVCANTRKSTKRRLLREQACAEYHQNGVAVADSAWDRAMAAVHEEVARLPERLRVPFVLCCLEGKGVTEAAEQLGWKLGTLSGRLSRAKDVLQARLENRGVTLGVAATSVAVTAGLANNVPAAILERATHWAQAGCRIPDSILQLSQGVLTMSVNKPMVWGTGLCVALCLGLGGVRWVSSAGAQEGPKLPPTNSRPADDATRTLGNYQNPDPKPNKHSSPAETKSEAIVGRTAKWDYDFVLASEMGTTKFIQFLQEREGRGWEFNGEVTLQHEGKAAAHWVFRRPSTGKTLGIVSAQLAGAKDRQALEAQIKRLQDELARTKEAENGSVQIVHLGKENQKSLASLIEVLENTATKKFGPGILKLTFETDERIHVRIDGSREAVEWAANAINQLYGQERGANATNPPPRP